MKYSILLTGSSGFIGTSVANFLKKKNYKIYYLVRKKKKLNKNEIFCDLSDHNSILSLKHKIKVNFIIHLGAHVGWNEKNDSSANYNSNILGTACLVSLSKFWNAKFIFASAALIHGIKKKNINLNSNINPDHPYMFSKYVCEQIILSSNIKNCILRIGGVYGYKGPEHLGINKMIMNASRGITPNIMGDGLAKRNYIYVEDVSNFIFKIINKNISGIHYVASNEILNIKQMVQIICNTLLKGKKPSKIKNNKSFSQIITPSKLLKCNYSFEKALLEINNKNIK